MKKTLSFILALVMMFCLISTAFAADNKTTQVTFTKPDPFTYTLTVPASTDFEDARSHPNGLYVNLDQPTFTLSDTTLLVYDETDDEYYIEYAGQRYEFDLTATCNGMSAGAGATAYDNTGFSSSGLKEWDSSISFYNNSGKGSVSFYSYWIGNDALAAMAPGTYTDTITWTVSIAPEV